MNCFRSAQVADRVCVARRQPRWTACSLVVAALLCVGVAAHETVYAQTTGGVVAAPDSPAAAPIPVKPPETFLQIVFSGGPIGVAIMLVLIATSMTALYLIIEQSLLLRRHRILPPDLSDRVREALEAGRRADAEEACHDEPSFLAFVLAHGLAESDGGWEAIEKALEDALAEQAARLFRRVEYLSVLANLAPMLGLLGTVVGMVLCFREVASTQGNAGAAQLAEGIYQALVTTVAGLMIAIPSLAAFALLRNRVDQFVAEGAYLAQHALAPFKRRKTLHRADDHWSRARRSAAPARGRSLMRIPSVAERSEVGINMTPLIDVVFQLLIFFLVSSHLARQEAQMPLPLPNAQTGLETELESDTPRLTLNILRDGGLVLSGRHVSRAELPDHLARWLATVGRDGELRIRGDRSVKYEHVEPLLATCARVGLPRVTFAVHEARDQVGRAVGAR